MLSVGASAKVLCNFTIGSGSKIGANTVVVKSIRVGDTIVGNPDTVVDNSESITLYNITSDSEKSLLKEESIECGTMSNIDKLIS
ncbi:MAG: hypothetical protein REV35_02730 [Burkholderia sp.]|nr:hypothetical protein [Burkholderia sp.]